MPETYASYGTNLTSTNETTVVTSVTGTSIVSAIHVSNVDASNLSSVTIKLYKGATGYTIVNSAAVPIQSTYQALDAPIPLTTGDTIKVTAGNANRLNVIVSVLEIT